MRGFSFGEINTLYNGIWTGPSDITARWMGTANLGQVEFLKGPSSLMTGLNAIGGAVNYVSRQPTGGPVQNEADVSVDSLGSVLGHYGSGGNTGVKGLDYRFDMAGSRLNSFIDGDYRDLTDLAGRVSAPCRSALCVPGQSNDDGRLYDRRRLWPSWTFRAGIWHCRSSKPVRVTFRVRNLTNAAHLRSQRVSQVVMPYRRVAPSSTWSCSPGSAHCA
jgi:outer membrane receptor protein involved in Fe transport